MSKAVFRELLTAAACYSNYISVYTLLFVWSETARVHLYHLIALAVASFAMGVFVSSYTKSILYSTVLLGVGAITAIAICIAPYMIYGAGMLDPLILWYGSIFARMLIVSLPLCVSLAFIGSLIGEAVPMHH